MKKFFIILLIIIAVVVVGALLARNIIATNLIEKGARNLVGLKLTISNINIGIFKTFVKVDDLKVYNPSGYTEKYIADLPNIYINYALMDIIKGFIHLPELDINIAQVNAEKDKNGVFNINHIQPKVESKPKAQKETKGKAKGFLIDKMNLKIGTVRYIDNSQTPPLRKKIDLNFSKTFTNLKDPKAIIDSILKEVAGQLVAQGIAVTVKSFLTDKEFMKSVVEGDTKGMKEAAAKNIKDLGKDLEQDIFKDDSGSTQQQPKVKKKGKEKEGLEGILEDVLEEQKQDKKK